MLFPVLPAPYPSKVAMAIGQVGANYRSSMWSLAKPTNLRSAASSLRNWYGTGCLETAQDSCAHASQCTAPWPGTAAAAQCQNGLQGSQDDARGPEAFGLGTLLLLWKERARTDFN